MEQTINITEEKLKEEFKFQPRRIEGREEKNNLRKKTILQTAFGLTDKEIEIMPKHVVNRWLKMYEQIGPDRTEIIKLRKSGRTTRLIDFHIQELFFTGRTEIQNHNDVDAISTLKMHIDLFDRVKKRLMNEHFCSYTPDKLDKLKEIIRFDRLFCIIEFL